MEYEKRENLYDSETVCPANGRELSNSPELAGSGDYTEGAQASLASGRLLGDTGSSLANGEAETWAEKARQINITALDFVLFSESGYFPSVPGIYFVIQDIKGIVYIGQAVNIANRWKAHPLIAVEKRDSVVRITHNVNKLSKLREHNT